MEKLSAGEKQQIRIAFEAELYRRDFYEFFVAATQVLYPQVDWDYNWHFKYIADILQAEVERIIRKEEKTQDIIINLPFRAGKSILLSQIFPVWCWVKAPELAIMQVSHSETLAIKHSHASKMLIESEWFLSHFPDLVLRVDTHAKANYMNAQGGKRISFGVKSGIIGEGANIQIIDDINNPQDSVAVTHTINETYTDTLYSRLNNSLIDIRIILQQRVNENDICGFLLNKNPLKYRHICLPARLTKETTPECIEYYQDGLFWKTRFSEKALQDYQQTLGSKAYAGQLMQKPYAEDGDVLKRAWFKTITLDDYTKLLEFHKDKTYEMFLDSAYTDKQKNDASAILIGIKINNTLYIRKAERYWLQFPDLITKLKELQIKFKIRIINIETKASGISIIQQLRRDGFNISELKANGDKLSRVNSVTPIIEGGRVCIVEDSWNESFLAECAGFPYGSTDDLVDVLAYGVNKLLAISGMKYKTG